jgi:hypothetical protein
MMLLGVSVGLWLALGPRAIGEVVFDVHTLLYSAAAVIIGFQSTIFAAFTKVFASNEGLLPPNEALLRWTQKITLETGLLLGLGLILAGLFVSFGAVWIWEQRQFGTLDARQTLRLAIPGVTALILGWQTIFASFFLSALGLKRH